MKQLLHLLIAGLAIHLGTAADFSGPDKLVCYWNASSFLRSGPAKIEVIDLKPALSLCTHLIYGFAGINSKSEIEPLYPKVENDNKIALYREIISLKKCFPNLKIYLSVGGNADPDQKYYKYLNTIETSAARNKFINSVIKLLKNYDFDGIDLAWQLPYIKPKKTDNSYSTSFLNYAKSMVGYGDFKDDKVLEHRKGFSNLVWDLKAQLKPKNKALTLTVLHHVDVNAYYDPKLLAPAFDAIHIMAFDRTSPDRNPKEADYPAPIYSQYDTAHPNCIQEQVRYWSDQEVPKNKIVIGIPTYGLTWKLSKSDIIVSTGIPPLPANGPGPEGSISATPGLLSYGEVCTSLNDKSAQLQCVDDKASFSRSNGAYAYRPYNPKTKIDGIWIGYESHLSAENKALFVKNNGLGGLAIWDLSNDDFHGVCDGNRYPITSAARFKLY